jgi:LacI family transcriptional regulator
MSPYLSGEALGRLVPERVPLMLMNTRVEGEGWDWMDIDNHGGAYAVTAHLVRGGHRRIALIRGAAGNHDAEERVRGYREALRDGGAEWEVALELAGDFTEESGYRAAARLLEVEPRPTAVFASNDSMAIGALSGLRERGVAVPGEMAVVGFDDIPIARYVDPPLTTVRVPMSRLGARAAERLLEAIAGGSGQVRGGEVVETELVVRASCGIATGAVRGGGG